MISGRDFKDPFKFEKRNKEYKVSEVNAGDQHSLSTDAQIAANEIGAEDLD